MTEDEFRIIERKMEINRGEVSHCGCPVNGPHTVNCPTTLGDMARDAASADSVEWPEYLIEAECTRLLEQDGWRALRTDPVSDRGRGKGFGELGMADHLYLRYPHVDSGGVVRENILWVEFKSAKGRPQSHQIDWHAKERARGALTWLAGVDFPASVAGFVEHYRKSGLNRGRV